METSRRSFLKGAASGAAVAALPAASVPVFAELAPVSPRAGWLSGQAVSSNVYAKLFAQCGTEYGAGDGLATFNLPRGGSAEVVAPGPAAQHL